MMYRNVFDSVYALLKYGTWKRKKLIKMELQLEVLKVNWIFALWIKVNILPLRKKKSYRIIINPEILLGRLESNSNGAELFADGMVSLKKLLPLFDTGWGSLYDLRHFTTHVAPNRARWDYHTTHITQLLLLASIDDDPVLSSTAQRWKEYMAGHRASHN